MNANDAIQTLLHAFAQSGATPEHLQKLIEIAQSNLSAEDMERQLLMLNYQVRHA
jgi:hypothetical protein